MSKVVTVFNSKGGVGKTHLAFRLAQVLTDQAQITGRRSVLAVDADEEQESLLLWADAAGQLPFDVVPLRQVGLRGGEYDYVVVDTPPNVEDVIRIALADSHLGVMPVTPDDVVVAALPRNRRLVAQARQANPALRVVAVLNAVESGTREARGSLRESVSVAALQPAQVGGVSEPAPPGGWWQVAQAEIPRRVEIRRGFGEPPPGDGRRTAVLESYWNLGHWIRDELR